MATNQSIADSPAVFHEKEKLTFKGAAIGFTDSFITGFAFYSAFILQKILFDLQDRQFLIGQKELVQMSAGIAFCYAFIFVLRKGYLTSVYLNRPGSIKQVAWFTTETYVLNLAMLFLVKDVNFTATRIAIGAGFIFSLVLIPLARFCYPKASKKTADKANRRRIIFKGYKEPGDIVKPIHLDHVYNDRNKKNRSDIFKPARRDNTAIVGSSEDVTSVEDTK